MKPPPRAARQASGLGLVLCIYRYKEENKKSLKLFHMESQDFTVSHLVQYCTVFPNAILNANLVLSLCICTCLLFFLTSAVFDEAVYLTTKRFTGCSDHIWWCLTTCHRWARRRRTRQRPTWNRRTVWLIRPLLPSARPLTRPHSCTPEWDISMVSCNLIYCNSYDIPTPRN